MKLCQVAIEREGAAVFLALRQGGRAATLQLSRRGASMLAAALAAATSSEDDAEFECGLRAELTTNGSDDDSPTISD